MGKMIKVLGFYNEKPLVIVGIEHKNEKPGYYYFDCKHRIGAPRVEKTIKIINKFLDSSIHKNRIWNKNIDMLLYVTKDLQIPSNIRIKFRSMVESKNVKFGEFEVDESIVSELNVVTKKVEKERFNFEGSDLLSQYTLLYIIYDSDNRSEWISESIKYLTKIKTQVDKMKSENKDVTDIFLIKYLYLKYLSNDKYIWDSIRFANKIIQVKSNYDVMKNRKIKSNLEKVYSEYINYINQRITLEDLQNLMNNSRID